MNLCEHCRKSVIKCRVTYSEHSQGDDQIHRLFVNLKHRFCFVCAKQVNEVVARLMGQFADEFGQTPEERS